MKIPQSKTADNIGRDDTRGVAGCPRLRGQRATKCARGGDFPPLNNFFCKETGSPCNRAHVRDVFHCGKFCKRIVAHFVFDVDDIVGDVAAVLVYHARDIE